MCAAGVRIMLFRYGIPKLLEIPIHKRHTCAIRTRMRVELGGKCLIVELLCSVSNRGIGIYLLRKAKGIAAFEQLIIKMFSVSLCGRTTRAFVVYF